MKTQIQKLNNSLRYGQAFLRLEMIQIQELFSLLVKSFKQPLTEAEKVKARGQLLDLVKVFSLIVIIVLPFSCFTLPILYKFIPKHILLPSVFFALG